MHDPDVVSDSGSGLPTARSGARSRSALVTPHEGELLARQALRRAIEAAGSTLAWSRKNGVERSLVSNIISGRAHVTPQVAQVLGYEKMTIYRKREG